MKYIQSKGGYYYKMYNNGKKKRISKEDFMKHKNKNKKQYKKKYKMKGGRILNVNEDLLMNGQYNFYSIFDLLNEGDIEDLYRDLSLKDYNIFLKLLKFHFKNIKEYNLKDVTWSSFFYFILGIIPDSIDDTFVRKLKNYIIKIQTKQRPLKQLAHFNKIKAALQIICQIFLIKYNKNTKLRNEYKELKDINKWTNTQMQIYFELMEIAEIPGVKTSNQYINEYINRRPNDSAELTSIRKQINREQSSTPAASSPAPAASSPAPAASSTPVASSPAPAASSPAPAASSPAPVANLSRDKICLIPESTISQYINKRQPSNMMFDTPTCVSRDQSNCSYNCYVAIFGIRNSKNVITQDIRQYITHHNSELKYRYIDLWEEILCTGKILFSQSEFKFQILDIREIDTIIKDNSGILHRLGGSIFTQHRLLPEGTILDKDTSVLNNKESFITTMDQKEFAIINNSGETLLIYRLEKIGYLFFNSHKTTGFYFISENGFSSFLDEQGYFDPSREDSFIALVDFSKD